MKNTITISIVIIVLAIFGAMILGFSMRKTIGLGSALSDNVFGTATNASATISALKATQILAANRDRQLFYACSEGPSLIYLHLAASSTDVNTGEGYRMASSSPDNCFRIDVNNLYLGAISAIASGTTSTINYIVAP